MGYTLDLTEIQISTPIGRFVAAMDGVGVVRAARFDDGGFAVPWRSDTPGAAELRARVAAYFEGGLTGLQGLPAAPSGTAFQLKVWDALRRSAMGQIMSYSALAGRLGLQGHESARAVGAANAANPIALLTPCHRVIASDGRLLGYAWGVERKRWLLRHEANFASSDSQQRRLF